MRPAVDAARDGATVATAEDALDVARLFQRIVEHCPDCFWTTSLEPDGTRRVRYVSPGWTRIWGWPAEGLYEDSQLWLEAILEDDRARAMAAFEAVRGGEGSRTVRYRIRARGGEIRWIEDRMTPIVDASGRVVALDGIARDISGLRRAENALLRSERQLRHLSDAIREVFWLTDWTERRVLHVSPAYETIWGRSCASLYAEPRSWADAIHPDDRAAAVAAFERDAERGGYDVRYRVVRPDGSIRWIHDRAFPLCDEDGRVARVAGVSEDITERVACAERERLDRARLEQEVHERTASLRATNSRLEEEIRCRLRAEGAITAHQQRLRSLASELSLAEERERRRIARDLHDHIAQNLGLAQLRLEGLRGRHADPDLDAALQLLRRSIRDARTLMFDLSPPMLYDLGFEPAVEWLVEQQQQLTDLPIEFEDDGAPKPLDEGLRVILFRAVRELLVNVAKHARAGRARVTVARDGAEIRIEVADDGVGFPAAPLAAHTDDGGGFGLFSIREQLERHGGRLAIGPGPKRGAEVTIVAPLSTAPRETAT